MIFTVNERSIDTHAYEVRRNGERISVEPQVFDLLVLLLENRERVVTKDEIIERVWNGRIVTEAALSSRIMAARQAIGDDGASQACIRTVRRRGFRVVADVTVSQRADALPAATIIPSVLISADALGMPAGPGIAVLPFNYPANDATLELFRDGVTNDIVTELTRFSELRVAARALTSKYEGRDVDVLSAAQTLGVEFLLQGGLLRIGERLRVSAQLFKGVDGTIVWAETYDRSLTLSDLFAVQEDVASKVVTAIASISAGVIARERLGQARAKPPREINAYECTIRANELMSSGFSAESHLAIRSALEAAVASEPDYAAAWAMLSWLHTLEYTYEYNKRLESDPRERALAAALRAVELAPANPMARFAMARAAYLMRDLDVFYAEASRALSLNPHEPFLLGNLGNWLAFSGRWEEGVTLIRKAITLNPTIYPRWWHAALGKDHYRKGDYQHALTEFKSMNLPDWWWNQVELAYTYGQLGDRHNAQRAVSKLLDLYPDFDLSKAVLEHQKFCFEPSYIDHAVDGLRKAGVPEKSV